MNKLLLIIVLLQIVLIQSKQSLRSGKVAPLFPEEFSASMVQNKFNHNGFVVNHTCYGSYYSSFARQVIRSDCTAQGMVSNNMSDPTPIASSIMLSLIDFNQWPPINVFIEWNNALTQPSCSIYEAEWLPPQDKNFLRNVGAVYGGLEEESQYGVLEKWNVMLMGNSFTFYFSQSSQELAGYDFFSNDSEQGPVGVTTRFNYITVGERADFLDQIYEVPSSCPSYTISSS